jgi:hypothetical protein
LGVGGFGAPSVCPEGVVLLLLLVASLLFLFAQPGLRRVLRRYAAKEWNAALVQGMACGSIAFITALLKLSVINKINHG